tara:strand:+ start:88 stop:534 length:447 start_codon:yes stop_codon:yes gene_type:complete
MGISDALDGMIARHLKSESSLGAYLDAIADKIMIIVSFFMLCSASILPYYLFFTILLRDIAILFGILINIKFSEKFVMRPMFISKLNTFMQITLVLICLLFLNKMINLTHIQDIINVVIVTTIFSLAEYLYNFKRQFISKNLNYTSKT